MNCSDEVVRYWQAYLEKATPLSKQWLDRELTFVKQKVRSNSRVLDVGCGFARHMKALAPQVREIVGVDHNPTAISTAQRNLDRIPNTQLYLQEACNLENLGLFDYVICMGNTLGNFDKRKLAALREMAQVLDVSGQMIVSVYSERALTDRLETYKKIGFSYSRREGTTIYSNQGTVTEQFTRKQLEDLFSKAGLKSKITELNPISYICELQK